MASTILSSDNGAALFPPAVLSFPKWRWEATLDGLRKSVPEELLRAHWKPTGHLLTDARARAHIAEWALFSGAVPWPTPLDEVEIQIFAALKASTRDLFIVEASDTRRWVLRGLRAPRGYCLDWLEGREELATHQIIAARLIELPGPGALASTLPLCFDSTFEKDEGSPIPALLRAYGASSLATSWDEFMKAQGDLICLEYALEKLRRECREEPTTVSALTDHIRGLHKDFCTLKMNLSRCANPFEPALLPDGSIAVIEDVLDGPQVILFETKEHQERYFRAQEFRRKEAVSDSNEEEGVPWLRVHFLDGPEVHPVEWELALRAGIEPSVEGMIRVQARNQNQHFVDPTLEDLLRLREACRTLSQR